MSKSGTTGPQGIQMFCWNVVSGETTNRCKVYLGIKGPSLLLPVPSSNDGVPYQTQSKPDLLSSKIESPQTILFSTTVKVLPPWILLKLIFFVKKRLLTRRAE